MASLPTRSKSQPKSKSGFSEQTTTKPQSRLEALPDELLLHIVDHVDNEDICSFGYCCWRIRGVARVAVQNHQRRRRYYTLRCGVIGDPTRLPSHPIHILRDIILDDGITTYTTKLILGDLFPKKKLVESSVEPILFSHRAKIRDIIFQSPYFSASKFPKAIDEVLRLEIRGTLLSSLLELLPNLQSIELRDQSVRQSSIKSLIGAVARANKKKPNENHALSNLTTINIDLTRGEFEDFTLLAQWTCLPSLQSIQATGLHSSQNAIDLVSIDPPERDSNVTTLDFTKSMINDDDFEILFGAIKDLKTFKYEYGFPNNTIGSRREFRLGYEEWNIGAVVDLLSTHASHSLVELDLTITDNPRIYHGNRVAGRIFVGTLKHFHLLKKLRADTMIFTESEMEKPLITYGLKYPEDDHDELYARILDDAKEDPPQHVRQFVDILPASIEELVLSLTPKAATSKPELMFEGMLERKRKELPELKVIYWEGLEPRTLGEMWYCKGLGIEMSWQGFELPLEESLK